MSIVPVSPQDLITRGRKALDGEIQNGDTLLLDFFAGAGGATQGFVLAGFKPVYIVEGDESKRKQYLQNFGNVEVFHRKRDGKRDYFVYEKTATGDAQIIIDSLRIFVGRKKVRYHVHASPSCRQFCAVGRSTNSKTSKLGDSVGTFHWTCDVLKILKDKFGDKMTWSVEDAAEVAGESKRFNFPKLRERLPANHFNVWDFTLWGVPQDRKRFIALDETLDISNLPGYVDPTEIGDDYLAKLVTQLNIAETDDRKYGKNKMQGRIGMDTAFRLAGIKIPSGVTHMIGQASKAQVPNLIRAYNKDLKGSEGKKRNEIYVALTKLAYDDLVKFIQSCTPDIVEHFYDDKEIKEYANRAYLWLKDVDLNHIEQYCNAMVDAMGGVDAFATATQKSKTAHASIPLENIVEKIDKGKLRENIEEVLKENKNAKTSDLRDCFGLRIARFYSNDVKSDGTNINKPPTVKRIREIWAPAFTIQASGDKNWYRPLFEDKNDFDTFDTDPPSDAWYDEMWTKALREAGALDVKAHDVLPTKKKWHSTGMKFSFLSTEQLKTLGTFPLNYDFGTSSRDDVRIAVGDSVPPLITLRLGLCILKESASNEEALQAVLNFTPTTTMMKDLYDEYSKYLIDEREVSQDTHNRYLKVVKEHFASNEFLGEQMLIKFTIGKKHNRDRGVDQSAALRWIELLEGLVVKNFFSASRLKDHILKQGLWKEEKHWLKLNTWAHESKEKQTLKDSKEKLNEYTTTVQNYMMKQDTKDILMRGFYVRQRILGYVFSVITAIRKAKQDEVDHEVDDEVVYLKTVPAIGNVKWRVKLKF